NNMEIALNHKLTPFQIDNIKELYKFRTSTWYTDGKEIYKLRRGHRTFSDITKADLWDAIQLTKDNYFSHVVDKQGKFIYSYFPAHDISEKKYNILRHAGTTFSMLQTYELMPEDSLMDNIKKTLAYLGSKVEIHQKNENQRVVVERDTVKLGANALAIVAMAKYTNVTGDKKYIPVMQQMAAWIKEVQEKDGRFS